MSSSSSRSLTRPVQQQWWSWWSSSGPPSPHILSGEAELLMATVRFALVGVCYISEEHARLSGPPHHRDTFGEGTILVSCACVLWACCGRNAVVPKPPGRACQEGGKHPSPVWVSTLFWWWWSFPGNGCWLMVALLVQYRQVICLYLISNIFIVSKGEGKSYLTYSDTNVRLYPCHLFQTSDPFPMTHNHLPSPHDLYP